MPYCSGKSKAQIKFKYPNDSDWTIFNSNYPPVDYSLEEQNTCENKRYRIDWLLENVIDLYYPYADGNHCSWQSYGASGSNNRGAAYVWGAIGQHVMIEQKSGYCAYSYESRMNGTAGHSYQGFSKLMLWCKGVADDPANQPPANNYHWVQIFYKPGIWSAPGALFNWSNLTHFAAVPDDPSLVCTSCKFTITDTRGKVYERTEPTCPTVSVVCGNTCPPQTVCECDCGTEVCCYDATGTPIYSYPK